MAPRPRRPAVSEVRSAAPTVAELESARAFAPLLATVTPGKSEMAQRMAGVLVWGAAAAAALGSDNVSLVPSPNCSRTVGATFCYEGQEADVLTAGRLDPLACKIAAHEAHLARGSCSSAGFHFYKGDDPVFKKVGLWFKTKEEEAHPYDMAAMTCSALLTNVTCKQDASCAWCGGDGSWRPVGRGGQCYNPTTQKCTPGDLDCYPLVCNSSSMVCQPNRGCGYGAQPLCFAAEGQQCCSARHGVSACAAAKGEKCCATDGYTACYTDEQECCNPWAPVVMPVVCPKGKCPPTGQNVCAK